MSKPARPKDWDRPGRRGQLAARTDLRAPTLHDYATCDRPAGGFDQLEIRCLAAEDAEALLSRMDLGTREREEAQARANGQSLSRRRDVDE